jgi:hypothetical protein
MNPVDLWALLFLDFVRGDKVTYEKQKVLPKCADGTVAFDYIPPGARRR